jgi:hypothetical protein
MAESDDRLARAYRGLPREEPPEALDAAILGAARASVRPRARNRWAGPFAIAAVLVLGLGIALRMQVERPGIETAAPTSSSSAEYPTAGLSEEPPLPAERSALTGDVAAALPARKEATPEKGAPPRATKPLPATAPAPAPSAAPRQPSLAPSAQHKPDMASENVPAPTAKRAETTAGDTGRSPKDARETELERIARLRADGRHAEADKALEEFRSRHPDYRIAQPMWERLKPH